MLGFDPFLAKCLGWTVGLGIAAFAEGFENLSKKRAKRSSAKEKEIQEQLNKLQEKVEEFEKRERMREMKF